jgi:thymidylate synthase
MEEFADFHSAFHDILGRLLAVQSITAGTNSPRSIGSKFGAAERTSFELLAHSFAILNPRSRSLPCRGADNRYAIANFFWTVAGKGDLESIVFYNPKGQAFAEDNELKCAVPSRLSNSRGGSQLDDVISILRKDPSSRRALITFTRPEDIAEDALDFPCPATMQFLIREDKLIVIVSMRSQSAYGVLPYDVYLFTMIQEMVAIELGIEVGKYIHISNSIHIYEDEVGKVKELLDCSLVSGEMEKMTLPSPVTDSSILGAEKTIRMAGNFVKTGYGYWDNRLADLII